MNPLDTQVSEIRHLIDRLRSKDGGADSALTSRKPRTRGRDSSRPRRAMPTALTTTTRGTSGVESRLLPICERLEGALERMETRLDAAPAAPAGGDLPPLSDDCALRGRISESLLPDLLQMVTSNRWTGVFVVQDGPLECRLYFDEGQACHAEAPGTSGEGAFFAALALEQGEYHFLEMAAPPEKTITSNTQFLILEALRQIDEAKGA